MDHLFGRLKLLKGSKLNDILSSQEADEFVAGAIDYASATYYRSFLPQFSGQVQKSIDLELSLLVPAIKSAYIDLFQSTSIHELAENAPSPIRKGAAVTAWINRLKPIQIRSSAEDSKVLWINPTFALHVGWSMAWDMHNPGMTGTDTPAHAAFVEILSDHSMANDLIYHLTWRSPGYREMTILFDALFLPK